MSRKVFTAFFLLAVLLTTVSCAPKRSAPTQEVGLPNPASVYCEEHGGKVDLRTDAMGGVAGVCVFPDGSECDEWAYFRGECGPGKSASNEASEPAPTELPIDPADYQGWWAYTHAVYGFSIQLPEDWEVADVSSSAPILNGHLLTLSPKDNPGNESIRMTFRRAGEDVLLWPTGVGEGEFVPQGTLSVAGQPVKRVLLVCPNGQVTSIWYQGETDPNIQRGDLEFGFIFGSGGIHCQAGFSLDDKTQHTGEMIIASLSLP